MEFQVLGIGDAFTADHFNTSFLVHAPEPVLIDGPNALFRLFKERKIAREAVNHVVLTHIHGDHSSGLETLLLWKKYAEKRKVTLYTTDDVFEEFKQRVFPRFQTTFGPDLKTIVSKDLHDYLDFVGLDDIERTSVQGWFDIQVRKNWHPATTLGLKLFLDGFTVSVSGDTCYRPRLLEELRAEGQLSQIRYERLNGAWLWESDVIYHEVQRGDESTPHTLEKHLLELPSEIRDKIRLVHIPDDFEANSLPVARPGEKVGLDQDRRISIR